MDNTEASGLDVFIFFSIMIGFIVGTIIIINKINKSIRNKTLKKLQDNVEFDPDSINDETVFGRVVGRLMGSNPIDYDGDSYCYLREDTHKHYMEDIIQPETDLERSMREEHIGFTNIDNGINAPRRSVFSAPKLTSSTHERVKHVGFDKSWARGLYVLTDNNKICYLNGFGDNFDDIADNIDTTTEYIPDETYYTDTKVFTHRKQKKVATITGVPMNKAIMVIGNITQNIAGAYTITPSNKYTYLGTETFNQILDKYR